MTAPVPVPIEQWPGLLVGQVVAEGARSQVWRGELDGRPVAIRRTKRSLPSLAWELQLLVDLDAAGFLVPEPLPTVDGELQWQGWNVQRWIEGQEPSTAEHWRSVATTLRAIHRKFRGYRQRPGACGVLDLAVARRSVDADIDRTPADVVAACVAHFDTYLEAQRSVIHGDLHPGNIRVDAAGRVGLLDWDEARVDVVDLDLSNLAVPVLTGRRRQVAEAVADAWETLNGWVLEPDYARSRFERLPPLAASPPPFTLGDGLVALRLRTEADAEAQLVGEDEVFTTWLTGGDATIERIREHITNAARCWAVDGMRQNLGIYSTASPQPLIGNLDINFADMDLELGEVNLSYGIFGPWRRKGHGTAALAVALDHLRRSGRPEIPTLKIDPRNEPSVALARSAGFVETRTVVGGYGGHGHGGLGDKDDSDGVSDDDLVIWQRPDR